VPEPVGLTEVTHDLWQPKVAEAVESDIRAALDRYHGHGLKDLNKANLMKRIDTKFMVKASYIPELLDALQHSYTALQIDDARLFRYTTTYFDTPDMLLFKLHHGGRLNRFKVRAREYHDTDTSFLEVKFKDNRRVTTKKRVSIPAVSDAIIRQHGDFLTRLGVPQWDRLLPVQVGSYRRIALANEASGERITIDLGLCYAQPADHGRPLMLTEIAIIEVKQGSFNRHSPTIVHLRKHGFRPASFSKYCIGQCLTQDQLKINRFKPILRDVARMQNTQIEAFKHARTAHIGH
jgi:hypothetical protein